MERSLHLAEVPTGTARLDVLLPSQFFGARRKQAPEHRLMIAVLDDALDCVEKYRLATAVGGRRLFREAQQWFLAEEPHWPYSFECICGVLDLDSKAVLQRLRLAPAHPASPHPKSSSARRQMSLLERYEIRRQRWPAAPKSAPGE